MLRLRQQSELEVARGDLAYSNTTLARAPLFAKFDQKVAWLRMIQEGEVSLLHNQFTKLQIPLQTACLIYPNLQQMPQRIDGVSGEGPLAV